MEFRENKYDNPRSSIISNNHSYFNYEDTDTGEQQVRDDLVSQS